MQRLCMSSKLSGKNLKKISAVEQKECIFKITFLANLQLPPPPLPHHTHTHTQTTLPIEDYVTNKI